VEKVQKNGLVSDIQENTPAKTIAHPLPWGRKIFPGNPAPQVINWSGKDE